MSPKNEYPRVAKIKVKSIGSPKDTVHMDTVNDIDVVDHNDGFPDLSNLETIQIKNTISIKPKFQSIYLPKVNKL